jgi:GNAT superfamily N-acetyltransferase
MNHINIKSFKLSEIDNLTLDHFCNFIKHYYVASAPVHSFAYNSESPIATTVYNPSKSNIIDYMKGSNHESYITLYQEPRLLFQKGEVISSVNNIVGVISARCLNICLKGKFNFQLYYVDNLCVHPEYRGKGIAAEIIQTHYYNLRKNNSKINACLFKREDKLTAIVPLATYNTYCYDISGLIFPDDKSIHASIKVIEIGIQQLPLLVEFINTLKGHFDCVILPDLTNLANMIKTDNIIIYGVITNAKLLSIYVFRNTQLYYNSRRSIECILTLYDYNKEIFITGFNIALGKLKNRFKNDIIMIEDNSHSNRLIDNFKILNVLPLFHSPTAFFLYNYACYSVNNRSFLILY